MSIYLNLCLFITSFRKSEFTAKLSYASSGIPKKLRFRKTEALIEFFFIELTNGCRIHCNSCGNI